MKVLGWVFVQIVKFLEWILLKVEVAGLEHIPETGPVILALNHVNFLDAILYTLIPRETRALAKKETWLRLPRTARMAWRTVVGSA